MTYHKPNATETFVYKRIKGAGISDDSSSEEHDIERKMDLSAFRITPQDFKKLTPKELEMKYYRLKSFISSYADIELPDLPEIHDGYSKVRQRKIISEAVSKVLSDHPEVEEALESEESSSSESESEEKGRGIGRGIGGDPRTWSPTGRPIMRPDYSRMLQHERELSGLAPRGRGRPKKVPETYHIDINSHNVRDGKYTMGDGIGPSRQRQYRPREQQDTVDRILDRMRAFGQRPPPLRRTRSETIARERERRAQETQEEREAREERERVVGEEGRGLFGAGILDDEDIVRMESLMEHMIRQHKPKNILQGIKQEDISKLMKTVEASKTAQAGSKESLETARRALRERLARETKPTKRKTKVEADKTKKEKEIEAINKAFSSKQKKAFKKGSAEAKDYMAHLRSLRKK